MNKNTYKCFQERVQAWQKHGQSIFSSFVFAKHLQETLQYIWHLTPPPPPPQIHKPSCSIVLLIISIEVATAK